MIKDILERLDRILLLKNTIIKTEHTYNALVEYINSLLRDYCVLFEKRFYTDFYEYRLLYSCNDNKTCIHVIIKSTPINNEYDRIVTSYTWFNDSTLLNKQVQNVGISVYHKFMV